MRSAPAGAVRRSRSEPRGLLPPLRLRSRRHARRLGRRSGLGGERDAARPRPSGTPRDSSRRCRRAWDASAPPVEPRGHGSWPGLGVDRPRDRSLPRGLCTGSPRPDAAPRRDHASALRTPASRRMPLAADQQAARLHRGDSVWPRGRGLLLGHGLRRRRRGAEARSARIAGARRALGRARRTHLPRGGFRGRRGDRTRGRDRQLRRHLGAPPRRRTPCLAARSPRRRCRSHRGPPT